MVCGRAGVSGAEWCCGAGGGDDGGVGDSIVSAAEYGTGGGMVVSEGELWGLAGKVLVVEVHPLAGAGHGLVH